MYILQSIPHRRPGWKSVYVVVVPTHTGPGGSCFSARSLHQPTPTPGGGVCDPERGADMCCTFADLIADELEGRTNSITNVAHMPVLLVARTAWVAGRPRGTSELSNITFSTLNHQSLNSQCSHSQLSMLTFSTLNHQIPNSQFSYSQFSHSQLSIHTFSNLN